MASALDGDGPRGVSGAGRRQPAPGSPRRGGREVPETLPGLLGGVSRGLSFLANFSSRPSPLPEPGVPNAREPRGHTPWGAAHPHLGLNQPPAERLGRAGLVSRGGIHGEPSLKLLLRPVPTLSALLPSFILRRSGRVARLPGQSRRGEDR